MRERRSPRLASRRCGARNISSERSVTCFARTNTTASPAIPSTTPAVRLTCSVCVSSTATFGPDSRSTYRGLGSEPSSGTSSYRVSGRARILPLCSRVLPQRWLSPTFVVGSPQWWTRGRPSCSSPALAWRPPSWQRCWAAAGGQCRCWLTERSRLHSSAPWPCRRASGSTSPAAQSRRSSRDGKGESQGEGDVRPERAPANVAHPTCVASRPATPPVGAATRSRPPVVADLRRLAAPHGAATRSRPRLVADLRRLAAPHGAATRVRRRVVADLRRLAALRGALRRSNPVTTSGRRQLASPTWASWRSNPGATSGRPRLASPRGPSWRCRAL